jgi:hypothetical protein
LEVPEGWAVSPDAMDVHLVPMEDMQSHTFTVTIPSGCPETRYNLRYSVNCRDRDYSVILTPVRLDAPRAPAKGDESTCIREECIVAPALVAVNVIDARFIKERRYAYVEGAEEELGTALESMGLDFHYLTNHEIAHSDLTSFDVIVIGPKAYNLRGELRENGSRFLEFIQRGGVLIVQYQWYGYDKGGFSPYPLEFNNPVDRVTDESAPVRILEPQDPLFCHPNPITSSDFDGWIHDRGLAFPARWDERYTALLSCADPGEKQQSGGFLSCPFGKGRYYYVGYSFFRQLPEGVSGAFRLFLNLLASGYGG